MEEASSISVTSELDHGPNITVALDQARELTSPSPYRVCTLVLGGGRFDLGRARRVES